MAINEQAFHPEAPAFARSRPDAYYAWLTSNGFPHQVAYDQTTAIFGAPKTPEQQQKEAASKQQQAGFAQVGGMIGGVVAGRYIMNNAGKWIDQITGAETPAQVVQQAATAQPVGAAATATPATQASWNAGADAAGATPQVISTEGGMSTIQTPTGPQQVPTESLNDPGFWGAVNWQQVAQGGLGLAQMYSAYQAYKSGDTAGAGIYGAAAAGNIAASGAIGAGTAAGASGAMGGYLIPGLNIVAGAYGGYQTAEALSDMAAGSKRTQTGVIGGATSGAAVGGAVGSIVPGVGTAIGAGVGAVVGAIAGAAGAYFGSSKKKPQMTRDAIRGVLQKNGILDENFQGTLADGTKVDMGKDGSYLKWSNIDKVAEAQPKAWGAAVPGADAIAAAYGFVGQKASDIAAWYARGAVSNAGDDPNIARANIQHFAKQQGLTPQMIQGKLDEALKDNRINQTKYNYYMDGVNQLFGGQTSGAAAPGSVQPVKRPEKGQVARQSSGLYRDDKGQLVAANSMRQALERAYNKPTDNKKKEL